MYIGKAVPNFETNFYTDIALFGGRVSAHATFAYTNGLTQFNYGALTSGAFALLPNSPSSTGARDPSRSVCGRHRRQHLHRLQLRTTVDRGDHTSREYVALQ